MYSNLKELTIMVHSYEAFFSSRNGFRYGFAKPTSFRTWIQPAGSGIRIRLRAFWRLIKYVMELFYMCNRMAFRTAFFFEELGSGVTVL